MNKNKEKQKAEIYYRDIGDYLTREKKLEIIKSSKSIGAKDFPWVRLEPNEHGDWISQRNVGFETYIPLAPEKKFDFTTQSFFVTFAIGLVSNRDAWVYNFSQKQIAQNMSRMIDFYNQETMRFSTEKKKNAKLKLEDFVDATPSKISWTRALRNDAKKEVVHSFDISYLRIGMHRPFEKQHLYFADDFIECPGLSKKLFPTKEHENLVICVSGMGSSKENTILISNHLVDLNCMDAGAQCFPLYFYEAKDKQVGDLFDVDTKEEYVQREGVSNFILERAQKLYGKTVTKEDLFYYVYGMLHSPNYREKYASDLKKMLPRLPLLETVKEFWAFSKTGRKLAELHLNYESLPAPDGVIVNGDDKGFFKVEKMRFPSKGEKQTILFNGSISISNIPLQAYDYIVNGKSAIEWIMERYQITTHKDSGIRNDPNDWALEHNKPRYVLDLLLSVINLSHQSAALISSLPKLSLETEQE